MDFEHVSIVGPTDGLGELASLSRRVIYLEEEEELADEGRSAWKSVLFYTHTINFCVI